MVLLLFLGQWNIRTTFLIASTSARNAEKVGEINKICDLWGHEVTNFVISWLFKISSNITKRSVSYSQLPLSRIRHTEKLLFQYSATVLARFSFFIYYVLKTCLILPLLKTGFLVPATIFFIQPSSDYAFVRFLTILRIQKSFSAKPRHCRRKVSPSRIVVEGKRRFH